MEDKFYIPLGQLLDKSNNSIYKLVVLAAKRSQAIAEGSPRLIEGSLDLKPSTAALNEIAKGKLKFKPSSKK